MTEKGRTDLKLYNWKGLSLKMNPIKEKIDIEVSMRKPSTRWALDRNIIIETAPGEIKIKECINLGDSATEENVIYEYKQEVDENDS